MKLKNIFLETSELERYNANIQVICLLASDLAGLYMWSGERVSHIGNLYFAAMNCRWGYEKTVLLLSASFWTQLHNNNHLLSFSFFFVFTFFLCMFFVPVENLARDHKQFILHQMNFSQHFFFYFVFSNRMFCCCYVCLRAILLTSELCMINSIATKHYEPIQLPSGTTKKKHFDFHLVAMQVNFNYPIFIWWKLQYSFASDKLLHRTCVHKNFRDIL